MIGLGGGEFRLPVLMYVIGFDARSAVPLNLLISLVTLAFSLAVRSHSVSLVAVVPHLPEMFGLLVGGMASAFYGAKLVNRLSNTGLVSAIATLLGLLGILMIAEALLPFQSGDLLPMVPLTHFSAGAVIGIFAPFDLSSESLLLPSNRPEQSLQFVKIRSLLLPALNVYLHRQIAEPMKQEKRHKPPAQRRIKIRFRTPEPAQETADAARHSRSCERGRAEQVVLTLNQSWRRQNR